MAKQQTDYVVFVRVPYETEDMRSTAWWEIGRASATSPEGAIAEAVQRTLEQTGSDPTAEVGREYRATPVRNWRGGEVEIEQRPTVRVRKPAAERKPAQKSGQNGAGAVDSARAPEPATL